MFIQPNEKLHTTSNRLKSWLVYPWWGRTTRTAFTQWTRLHDFRRSWDGVRRHRRGSHDETLVWVVVGYKALGSWWRHQVWGGGRAHVRRRRRQICEHNVKEVWGVSVSRLGKQKMFDFPHMKTSPSGGVASWPLIRALLSLAYCKRNLIYRQ